MTDTTKDQCRPKPGGNTRRIRGSLPRDSGKPEVGLLHKPKRRYISGAFCRMGGEKFDQQVGKWYVEYNEHGEKIIDRRKS